MADPVGYNVSYSFGGFQANNPSTPLPAPKVDNELANIATSIGSLLSSVTDIRRSDGALQNGLVDYDALASEIRLLFNNGAVDNATLLADAVASASGSATSASTSADAAAASAAIAAGLVNPAPLLAGAAVPEVTVNAATTTDIGAAASMRVVINGGATITSFGAQINRLRFVRFNGVSTLTNGATIALLRGRNRTTAVGDQGIYLSDATGAWRELNYITASGALFGNPLYFAEHFPSVIGDGVADDMAGLQGIIDLASANGGGRVVLTGGRTYRCVSSAAVTDQGLILKPNVTLDMNRATVNLECTGNVYGIRPQNDSHIVGPGTVAVTVSASLGSAQDIYHAPIALGAAYGEVTSVGALGPYINAVRWSIRGIRITNVRPDGYKIAGLGGMSHGVIEDIEFPSDSTSIGCVNLDWGTVGNIQSGNIPATRILFDAGTAYTVHPNNIDIRRLKIGVMSNPTSCPIRLSGVHAIRIDGFEIQRSNYCSVFHTGGDLSYEFANVDVRVRHCGIVIKNGMIASTGLTGNGIICDAYGDNLNTAIVGGYSPRVSAIATTDILFENIRAITGDFSATAGVGAIMGFMTGGTIRNCTLIGHKNGINVGNNVTRLLIEGGEINSCNQEGIYIGAGSVPPEEIRVEGAWCWSNCIGVVSAGIYMLNGKRHTITRCRLGNGGESFQDIGIKVDTSCLDVEVTNNHVVACANTAYVMGGATTFNCLRLYSGNTVDPSVVTVYGGVTITPVEYVYTGSLLRRFRAPRVALSGGITPPSGAWLTGDVIDYSDPQATGYKGVFCTASGSPGTWNRFGISV